MDSKLKRPLVALGVVAALALPAGAAAHGGGHGPKADHGSHGAKGSGFHGGKKGRALVVKGTVSAVGTGTIDVLVKSANHHGRALRGVLLEGHESIRGDAARLHRVHADAFLREVRRQRLCHALDRGADRR